MGAVLVAVAVPNEVGVGVGIGHSDEFTAVVAPELARPKSVSQYSIRIRPIPPLPVPADGSIEPPFTLTRLGPTLAPWTLTRTEPPAPAPP